jgi:hypothetical protein
LSTKTRLPSQKGNRMADSSSDSHPIKDAAARVAGEVASYHAGPVAGAATEWVAREVLTNPTVAEIYANTYLPSDERGERFPQRSTADEDD